MGFIVIAYLRRKTPLQILPNDLSGNRFYYERDERSAGRVSERLQLGRGVDILETSLIGDSQVIVDIYSRFLFEREVFARREQAELSTDEFCEIMAWAQKEAYGDGIDERFLQPYMWTWKPHYYYPDLSFYNFPYAFGLLFGLGLYAIYQQRGRAFVPDYQNLLASTGEGTAAQLAARLASIFTRILSGPPA